MAHLTLAGTSEDGRRLRLVDTEGAEHTLDVDDRLRAALRGAPARTGQMETRVDSSDNALRPRDIQARVRAGESPEAVAEAAGTPVERVLVYARPVLAERAHVADRAQRSSVRRRSGEPAPGGARTLGDLVALRLRALGTPDAEVLWDAWRRDDGRWSLHAAYDAPGRAGTASFTYDPPGNYVTLDDDDARWLVGEEVAAPEPEAAGAAATDDLEAARRRRRTVVDEADQELPLGADALALVRSADPDDPGPGDPGPGAAPGAGPDESTVDLTETAARVRGERDAAAPTTPATAPAGSSAAPPSDPAEAPADAPVEEQPARRPGKRGRRASVPSWDEIMFGGGDKG
ncbi:septation protein SepH [Nocardioides perillae]|uniref:DUF3071 domain-containing protein n=1 Tax=Nocardioides perillae TaxID=1119534 RepID=A0A7Y9RUR2_9ACTN|nr:septation protein SepH [Nocardioides perillae]NYG55684.1 hypothetical protein [Nocardioides perillae]